MKLSYRTHTHTHAHKQTCACALFPRSLPGGDCYGVTGICCMPHIACTHVLMCMSAKLTHSSPPPPLLFLRCEDLPAVDRAKRCWHRVIMIIPPVLKDDKKTRCEPDNLDGYMLIVLRDLQRMGPPLQSLNPPPSPECPNLPPDQHGVRLCACVYSRCAWAHAQLVFACMCVL